MKATPEFGQIVATLARVEVLTIAADASQSDVLDCRGFRIAAIEWPSAWTEADMTFLHCITKDGTFTPLNADGVEVTEAVTASTSSAISSNAQALSGLAFLKFRSGTATTAVTQAAERTIKVHLVAAA